MTRVQDSPRRTIAARRTLEAFPSDCYTSSARSRVRSAHLETHGPFGTLWVGLGLGCFYIALIWLNTLLGFFLTPLFVIPLTWLQDRVAASKKRA